MRLNGYELDSTPLINAFGGNLLAHLTCRSSLSNS